MLEMSQNTTGQRAIPQSKEALLKSYQKRLKDDIKSMIEHFTEIIKLGKVRNQKLNGECSEFLDQVGATKCFTAFLRLEYPKG